MNKLPEFDKKWNYSNPVGTREEFLKIYEATKDSASENYLLELKTQLARTHSFKREFDEANKYLDEVEAKLSSASELVKIRYYLERGRTSNSAGDKEKALALFTKGYELNINSAHDFFIVDIVHMLAIAEQDSQKKIAWNAKAIDLAEQSKNEKTRGWLGSLLNNSGWDYFEKKDYEQAKRFFKKAWDYRLSVDNGENKASTRIAKWSYAKSLRMLNQIDESLKLQMELEGEWEKSGGVDGYVFEELTELYLVKNDQASIKKYAALAYEHLSKDVWVQKNEAEKLERLKKLGES